MKRVTVILILSLFLFMLKANVLFYDNFDRADGDVGNGWQFSIPPEMLNSTIVNGIYQMDIPATGTTYHYFNEQTHGVVYVEYEWKVLLNNWHSCVFPVDNSVFIRCDWNGNLIYSMTSDFTSIVYITQINFEQWYNVKFAFDIDNNTFSFWLDGLLLINGVSSNVISSINSFNFLNRNSLESIQQIDEFIVYNDSPPPMPTNLYVVESVNSIVLNWDAVPEPLFVTYKIYRDIASNPTIEIAEVGPDVTTYSDMVRSAVNTDYYYRIKAVGRGGEESDYSEQVELVHLQPELRITGDPVNIDVGYGYEGTGSFTIHNDGNYDLHYSIDSSTSSNTTLNDDLVAYYPLDGNANDVSGNAYHGANYGALPSTDRFGLSNMASAYNGDGSDTILGDILDSTFVSGSFSISCWIYLNSYTGIDGNPGFIISKWNSYGFGNNSFILYADGRFSSNTRTSRAIYPTLNEWHSIIVIVDNFTAKIFLDGELVDTTLNNDFDDSSMNLIIGGFNTDSYSLNGNVDEVLFYDRSISQNETELLFNKYEPYTFVKTGTVQCGTNETVNINFGTANINYGLYTESLIIITNDSNHRITPMTLNANVIPPQIDTIPSEISLNFNVENNMRTHNFEVVNNGLGRLEYIIESSGELDDTNIVPYIPNHTYLGELYEHFYYVSNNSMTWHQAKDECVRIGGHLVTISSFEENALVNNTPEWCWIGITDEEIEGVWKDLEDNIVWIGGVSGFSPNGFYSAWCGGEPNNIGNEDYAQTFHANSWNDCSSDYILQYILELDDIICIDDKPIILNSFCSMSHCFSINATDLEEGKYIHTITILSNVPAPDDVIEIPVTIKVDYTPPLAVQNVVFDEVETDYHTLKIQWDENAISDSVYCYNVYRRREDSSNWSFVGSSETNEYLDSDFIGLDDCNFYYKVTAVDWVENEGAESSECMGYLMRFMPPEIVEDNILNNHDYHLSWHPVTQTLSGELGTPSCYVIYYNNIPVPEEDFIFLATTNDTTYVHQNIGLFQERMFYKVTAYGGSMRIMNLIKDNHPRFTSDDLPALLRRYKGQKKSDIGIKRISKSSNK